VQNGGVATFDGDLDDYRRLILSGKEDNAPRANTKASPGPAGSGSRAPGAGVRQASAQRRAELAALRKRIASAEDLSKRLAAEIAAIDVKLAELFASDPAKAADLAKTRAERAGRLARAEEEWLAASEAYEVAQA
jgi:ATP-binding cassette subfamily F protein 3